MTKREFVTLMFRLMAVYFVGQALMSLPALVSSFANMFLFASQSAVPFSPFLFYGIAAIPSLLLSGLGFILYIVAPGLARVFPNGDQPFLAGTDALIARAMIFTLAGLLLIGESIPSLVNWAAMANSQARVESVENARNMALGSAVKLLFAAVLLYLGGWRATHPAQWGRDPISACESSQPPHDAVS